MVFPKAVERRPEKAECIKSTHITREDIGITLETREQRNGHKAAVLWLTGFGSGKSTIAKKLLLNLWNRGCQVTMLDGTMFVMAFAATLVFQ